MLQEGLKTHPDPTILCTLDVSEALEDLQGEWSARDPRESWVALSRGPKGEHFVVEVDVGGRKCGAFVDIGSTRNFISRDGVDRLCLKDRVQRLSRPVASTLANKERMMVEDYVKDIVCTFSYPGGEINHKISFLVSDELPFDMLLGMYYLEVSKPQFDWDKKVLKHELRSGRTVRLAKYKGSRLIDSYGCLCASAFYNYYKQIHEEGMYLVYVSAKGEAVKTPQEIETIVAKYPDLFEERTGVVDREIVHAIEIIPGSKTPNGRIYRMAPAELDELRRQLKELTEKGWIRPSTSPFGSPVLFVPKKGGTLRMCIDSRGLNAITVKNAEPLPRIDDLLDRVQGCKYYTKIDLKSGYHQIAIRPEDQHKTAFQTRYGLYEFVVMPFGLCNASGTFQHAMNRIFHDYLDKFVVVYLDDILIFSRSVEEHAQHVDKVLSLLRQHKYKINYEKCEFGRTQILYLGHEVSADGIRPEDAKVASIRYWPRPQPVTKVRSFLGMRGYYRNFVKNYSTITSPLTDLTRLDTPWDMTDECEAAFKRLKHALTHHEVLMVPDPQRPFVVTTDASQYGIGAVLAKQEGKKLRPIEYMSKKMPSKKLAKSTYDRELYALYKALVHWRHYLLGSKNGKRHIFVIVDRFTKYARLIAMPETARTEDVIKLFMDNWMGSQLHMTSGNHPEANGQAEQMNRVVQHLLRHYIKPSQDDWDEKLPLIASLYNNAVHSTIGVSPNQLHLGWKPRSALDFLLPENRTAATPGTIEFGVQYEKLLQQTVEHIKKSQEVMIASENKRRRQSTFQVGERVWVEASELGQEFGISRKLMPQYFGPWEVLDIVGNDLDGPPYVIRIPGHLRTYPVFHTSKLAPFAETAQLPSRRSMLPPTMDGHVDVDDILDHRDTPVPKPPGRGRPPKPAREYREAKRLEWLRMRQQRELDQLIAFEMKRRRLAQEAEEKLMKEKQREEEERLLKVKRDREWQGELRMRELQRAKEEAELERKGRQMAAERYAQDMAQAAAERERQKQRQQEAAQREQERLEKQARRRLHPCIAKFFGLSHLFAKKTRGDGQEGPRKAGNHGRKEKAEAAG
ncbi:hypothetical protein CBR_g2740 [Chara braunii]|uniref:Reverse transcriptase domain-containing protein n=1 Tax=Chara braunii TaxID=69332 RepID=A0A388KDV8_CHABU|nr:hypothetical protein CBR_g2740 [Chara braunii]|eukprot:GBG68187.1 hypothetical protein CBR_g2740 [Chara braunii]